jgi:hypothetical protein
VSLEAGDDQRVARADPGQAGGDKGDLLERRDEMVDVVHGVLLGTKGVLLGRRVPAAHEYCERVSARG